jgi:hypothetical protein
VDSKPTLVSISIETAEIIMHVLDTSILSISSRRWTFSTLPADSGKDLSNLISFGLVRECNFHLLLSSPSICMLKQGPAKLNFSFVEVLSEESFVTFF